MVRKRIIETALTPWIPCWVGYHAGLDTLPCYWLLTPLPLVHCCMEARAVASVPLWPPVGQPSSLCRHSEPRRRPLPAGTRVLVQRPVAKPEHNGKRARAITGRYAAALDDGKELSLKAECVAKTGRAAAGCASEEASSVCALHSLRHGDSAYSGYSA